MISFKTTPAEFELITKIADRAVRLSHADGVDYEYQDAVMDLTAAHANGCPLQLRDLLTAEVFDFGHDIYGIRRHLNRSTGELQDCFVPRYAEGSNVSSLSK